MSHLVGRSLADEIKLRQENGERFSTTELRLFLEQILGGLEQLHRTGNLHLDIKPGNILLTKNLQNAVLVEFGNARFQYIAQQAVGTGIVSPYLPFEQFQAEGNLGPPSDLYSLAASFYRAITFEEPVSAAVRIRSENTSLLAHRQELVGEYGLPMLAAIDQALSVDVNGRPESAQEFLQLVKSPAPAMKESKKTPANQGFGDPLGAGNSPEDETGRTSTVVGSATESNGRGTQFVVNLEGNLGADGRSFTVNDRDALTGEFSTAMTGTLRQAEAAAPLGNARIVIGSWIVREMVAPGKGGWDIEWRYQFGRGTEPNAIKAEGEKDPGEQQGTNFRRKSGPVRDASARCWKQPTPSRSVSRTELSRRDPARRSQRRPCPRWPQLRP